MAIHKVDTICPVCAKISMLGHADMSEHPMKYICPKCKGRHYGKPEENKDGDYVCGKCGEASLVFDWNQILLDANEHIQGPYQSCDDCNKKLEPDKIAIIETEDGKTGEDGRTGRVFFIKPSAKFTDAIGDQRAVYMEKSVVAKLVEE